MHRHEMLTKEEMPFQGPVKKPLRFNPRAWHGITRILVCSCGMVKQVNRNENEYEEGSWTFLDKL